MIECKVDDSKARVLIQGIEGKAKNMAPAMRKIATELANSVQKNFDDGGRYSAPGSIMGGSKRWADAKRPPTYAGGKLKGKEKGTTLDRSGHLRRSIHEVSDGTSAGLETSMVYARIQNNGGTTKPHEIKARNGRALAFGMEGKQVLVRKVKHPGSKIAAKPYMVIQEEDLDYAKQTIADHLTK
ncbi:MAG: phage virion morphogenesis protein [Sphaerochaetaceae bacterium]